MPVIYTIEQSARLVRVVMTGHLTASDYFDYFRATTADPTFRSDMDRLVIATDVKSFPSSAEIQAISMEVRARGSRSPETHIAVVANTPLGLGMANMTLMQAGMDDRFETFPDEKAARDWLAEKRATG